MHNTGSLLCGFHIMMEFVVVVRWAHARGSQ